MYPPSQLGKQEQYNEPQAQHRLVPTWAGGGEGTVLNTAPLAWAMAASDNAEIQWEAKTGGQKIQEILKMSESSNKNWWYL